MVRTLITGAGGFTGPYVAALLAGRGHEVHGVVHEADQLKLPACEHAYVADLADLPSIARIVHEVRPDHVVHLAGIAFVPHTDVQQIYQSNIVGTRQLLEALASGPHRPRSVLLASSANVYGTQHEGVLDEQSELLPVNDYGVSKLAMEYVASLYSERLPLICARPFNYTGVGQSEKYIVPKIIAHARVRAAAIELGNIDVARDFSDVRTVAEIYARLLLEPQAVGETYNVCSGRAVTLAQILEMVREISGHRFDVRINPAFVRAKEVRVLRGSPEKLMGVIGSLSSIPLEETLRWMLQA